MAVIEGAGVGGSQIKNYVDNSNVSAILKNDFAYANSKKGREVEDLQLDDREDNESKAYRIYGEVATQNDGLNVRVEPGLDGQVITSLPKGSKIQVIEFDDGSGWTKVRLEDGTEGYVSSQYLSVDNPFTATQTSAINDGNYTVESGDNLSKIAREQLGDESRWREIAELNGIDPSNPRDIMPGEELKMPVPDTKNGTEKGYPSSTEGMYPDSHQTNEGHSASGSSGKTSTGQGGIQIPSGWTDMDGTTYDFLKTETLANGDTRAVFKDEKNNMYYEVIYDKEGKQQSIAPTNNVVHSAYNPGSMSSNKGLTEHTYAEVTTKDSGLIIRDSANGNSIGSAAKGEKLRIIEEDNGSGWTKIKTRDGKEGYVSSDYIKTESQKNGTGKGNSSSMNGVNQSTKTIPESQDQRPSHQTDLSNEANKPTNDPLDQRPSYMR